MYVCSYTGKQYVAFKWYSYMLMYVCKCVRYFVMEMFKNELRNYLEIYERMQLV